MNKCQCYKKISRSLIKNTSTGESSSAVVSSYDVMIIKLCHK